MSLTNLLTSNNLGLNCGNINLATINGLPPGSGTTGPTGSTGSTGSAGQTGATGAVGATGANSGLLIEFGSYYALMPSDNPNPIPINSAIEFPKNSIFRGTVTRLTSSSFNIGNVGVYQISCSVSITEACQIALYMNNTIQFNSISGRSSTSSMVNFSVLLNVLFANSVVNIINISATPITVTQYAGGGTNPVSASLVINRIL